MISCRQFPYHDWPMVATVYCFPYACLKTVSGPSSAGVTLQEDFLIC